MLQKKHHDDKLPMIMIKQQKCQGADSVGLTIFLLKGTSTLLIIGLSEYNNLNFSTLCKAQKHTLCFQVPGIIWKCNFSLQHLSKICNQLPKHVLHTSLQIWMSTCYLVGDKAALRSQGQVLQPSLDASSLQVLSYFRPSSFHLLCCKINADFHD